jgi:hypothetical protein
MKVAGVCVCVCVCVCSVSCRGRVRGVAGKSRRGEERIKFGASHVRWVLAPVLSAPEGGNVVVGRGGMRERRGKKQRNRKKSLLTRRAQLGEMERQGKKSAGPEEAPEADCSVFFLLAPMTRESASALDREEGGGQKRRTTRLTQPSRSLCLRRAECVEKQQHTQRTHTHSQQTWDEGLKSK